MSRPSGSCATPCEPSGSIRMRLRQPVADWPGGCSSWRLKRPATSDGSRRRSSAGSTNSSSFSSASSGRWRSGPQLFTVLGPAGIGKTRLARELVRSVGDRATVLQGHCPSYGEGITFWPLREIVEQVGDLSEALVGEGDADAIAERILGAVGLSGQQTTNEETFWAARKLIEALARRHPLVVLLEDAHWAEPALVDLVEHIVEWSSDAPIVFVCLGRSELVDERPSWPAAGQTSPRLSSSRSEQETDELIDALRGDIELSRETRARISASAEGNPLFIEQMLAMVAEQGGDGGGEVSIPPTIHALLAARLERLGPGERSVSNGAR